MSLRWPNSIVNKTFTTPTGAQSTPGLWKLSAVADYVRQNLWPKIIDPFFEYVSLLLNGDGAANGAQNNTFVDNSQLVPATAQIKYARVYSSYGGGLRSSNYSVSYSDDGSTWTTAFSGVMEANSVCGIITGSGGGGSYGTHKYWRYTVGSPVNSHHPRCSRIILSDGTNDYSIYAYVADNCSDSGGIPGNGTSFTANYVAVTRNGNTTQGTFSPYGNLWSNYFDGSGDYLSAPANAAFSFGTGNYTIEGWMFPNSNADGGTLIGSYPGAARGNWIIWLAGGGKLQFYQWPDYGGGLTGTTTIPIGKWTHFAVTCSSNTTRIFVNGVQENAVTATFPVGLSTNIVTIGRYQADNASYFNGYISNLRVIKGTALYTSNFTPSTTPLTAVSGTSLLTCQSNRFIDNSSNNFAITVNGDTSVQRFSPFNPTTAYSAATIGSSGYFDGNGDYLGISGGMPHGTGIPFTLELWVYRLNNDYTVITRGSSGSNTFDFGIQADGTIQLYLNGGATLVCASSAGAVKARSWAHIALTRTAANAYTIYVNGISVATNGSFATNITANTEVGYSSFTSTQCFNGYMADFRVSNTLVYSGNFTPPTAPLTAGTSDTALFLTFANAGIPDAAMQNDIETVGTAQVSTAQSKFGTGSLLFGGTNNYLYLRPSDNFNFGSGDFTVEFWVYYISSTSPLYQILYDNNYTSAGNNFTILVDMGRIRVYVNSINSGGFSTIVDPDNQWIHYAYVRNGLSLKLYRNGTYIAGATATPAWSLGNPSVPVYIGGSPNGNTNSVNGYLEDFRITKGYARYTADFTPPTEAFPVY